MKPRTRRVGVLRPDGHAAVVRAPVPGVRRGQVLVRVHASLISPGTELARARAARESGTEDQSAPRPFGYQGAGVVRDVGPGVRRFARGDRVACMGSGALHTDLAVVPQNLCFALPSRVSFQEGAYCHLGGTALQAVRRGRPELGEYVLVVGMGLVGQLSAQLAGLSGASVMAWDTKPGRLRIARQCGVEATVNPARKDVVAAADAFTAGRGFDLAILAFGGPGSEALAQVKSVMAHTPDGHAEGRIVIVGGVEASCQWAAGMGNLTVLSSARTGPGYHDRAWEHGRVAYPHPWVRWSTGENLDLVLRLIAQKRLRVKPLTTKVLPLSRIDDAVGLHLDSPDTTIGTVLTMRS